MIDRNDLTATAWEFLETAALVLSASGDIPMTFMIVGPTQTAVITTEDPAIINSPNGKEAIIKRVRKQIKKVDARVVFVIRRHVCNQVHGRREFAAGLVKRREAIQCQINTREAAATCIMYYRRDGNRIIWEEREDPDFKSVHQGRFSHYFND